MHFTITQKIQYMQREKEVLMKRLVLISIVLLLLAACAPVQKPKEQVKIAINIWPGYGLCVEISWIGG